MPTKLCITLILLYWVGLAHSAECLSPKNNQQQSLPLLSSSGFNTLFRISGEACLKVSDSTQVKKCHCLTRTSIREPRHVIQDFLKRAHQFNFVKQQRDQAKKLYEELADIEKLLISKANQPPQKCESLRTSLYPTLFSDFRSGKFPTDFEIIKIYPDIEKQCLELKKLDSQIKASEQEVHNSVTYEQQRIDGSTLKSFLNSQRINANDELARCYINKMNYSIENKASYEDRFKDIPYTKEMNGLLNLYSWNERDFTLNLKSGFKQEDSPEFISQETSKMLGPSFGFTHSAPSGKANFIYQRSIKPGETPSFIKKSLRKLQMKLLDKIDQTKVDRLTDRPVISSKKERESKLSNKKSKPFFVGLLPKYYKLKKRFFPEEQKIESRPSSVEKVNINNASAVNSNSQRHEKSINNSISSHASQENNYRQMPLGKVQEGVQDSERKTQKKIRPQQKTQSPTPKMPHQTHPSYRMAQQSKQGLKEKVQQEAKVFEQRNQQQAQTPQPETQKQETSPQREALKQRVYPQQETQKQRTTQQQINSKKSTNQRKKTTESKVLPSTKKLKLNPTGIIISTTSKKENTKGIKYLSWKEYQSMKPEELIKFSDSNSIIYVLKDKKVLRFKLISKNKKIRVINLNEY